MPMHIFGRSLGTSYRRKLFATVSIIMVGALAAACATTAAAPTPARSGSAHGAATATVGHPGPAATPGEGAIGVKDPASQAPDPSSGPPTASCSQASTVNAKALLPGAARAAAGLGAAPLGAEDLAAYATFIATGIAAYTDGPSSTVGWALGELLGTQGGQVPAALTAQLTQLSNQLDQITSQLNTIEGQLAAITNEIQDSTYIQAIKSLSTDHIAPILSMWQQYCDVVSSGDNNQATLKQLSSDILDSSTGIRAHITAIAQTFHGSSLTGDVALPGMFSQFLSNQGRAGTFDDRAVYQNYLGPYATYFASLAVMGMTLMVEAFHEQGDVPGAEAALKDLWADVREIYQASGHPISDDTVVTDNQTGTVWTRNGVCFVAQFDSADYQKWMKSSDTAQQALAWNAADDPDYTFKTGDSVCSTAWNALVIPPSNYLPTMITEDGLPSATLYSGTGDPGSVWHDPSSKDFQTLTAGKGNLLPAGISQRQRVRRPRQGRRRAEHPGLRLLAELRRSRSPRHLRRDQEHLYLPVPGTVRRRRLGQPLPPRHPTVLAGQRGLPRPRHHLRNQLAGCRLGRNPATSGRRQHDDHDDHDDQPQTDHRVTSSG